MRDVAKAALGDPSLRSSPVDVHRATVLVLTLPLQMLRIATRVRKRAGSNRNAIAYGILTMLSKWADVVGQLSYRRDRKAGRIARMIEYKGNGGPVARAAGM